MHDFIPFIICRLRNIHAFVFVLCKSDHGPKIISWYAQCYKFCIEPLVSIVFRKIELEKKLRYIFLFYLKTVCTFFITKQQNLIYFFPFNKIRYLVTYNILFELASSLDFFAQRNPKVIESISAWSTFALV